MIRVPWAVPCEKAQEPFFLGGGGNLAPFRAGKGAREGVIWPRSVTERHARHPFDVFALCGMESCFAVYFDTPFPTTFATGLASLASPRPYGTHAPTIPFVSRPRQFIENLLFRFKAF